MESLSHERVRARRSPKESQDFAGHRCCRIRHAAHHLPSKVRSAGVESDTAALDSQQLDGPPTLNLRSNEQCKRRLFRAWGREIRPAAGAKSSYCWGLTSRRADPHGAIRSPHEAGRTARQNIPKIAVDIRQTSGSVPHL
jgi:hypothetical protein